MSNLFQYSEEYLKCRDLGHIWDESPFLRAKRKVSVFERLLRCTRCGTEKIEWLTWEGRVTSRHYNYPDGYRVAQDLRVIQFRGERLRRANKASRAIATQKDNL